MDDQRVLSSRVTSKFMNLHSAKSNERTSTSDTEPSVLAFAMVDLSGLRSNPRPSAKGAALQASRRASSVPPAGSSKRPEWLESVALATPRKRKLAALASHTESRQSQATTPRMSRPPVSQDPRRRLQADARTPKSATRRSTANEPKAASSTLRTTRKRARTSSPSPQLAKKTRRVSRTQDDDDATDEDTGLLTPAPSSQSVSVSRLPTRSQRASSRSRTAVPVPTAGNKGKGKAVLREEPVDHESADASTPQRPEPERPTKRRRRASPAASVDGEFGAGTSSQPVSLSHTIAVDGRGDDEDVGSEDDASFQLLDIPEVAALPWVANTSSPTSRHHARTASLFLPPGVSELIEGMKRALDLETRARRRAEDRYTEEVQRRVAAERATAALVEQNRVLDAETRVWAQAAADTFALSLTSQIADGPQESGSTATQPLIGAAADGSADPAEPPMATSSADAKGKGRMPVRDSQTPVTGASSTVLERAAAVSEFFQQLVPLPSRDTPDGS